MILSEREKEALRLLLVGHDAKSIANLLGLSVHTVNDRLRDARRKMGATSSREAARRLAATEPGAPDIFGAKEIGGAEPAVPAPGTGVPAPRRSSGYGIAWLTGGMLIMSLLIAALALSMMAGTDRAGPPSPRDAATTLQKPAETKAASIARAWLELVDTGQWESSWNAAGTLFQTNLPTAQWTATIQSVRQPLGLVSSRVLQSAVETKTLPGVPDGDYQVLQFKTRFATKPEAIETVILAREQAGWRVAGYFIR